MNCITEGCEGSANLRTVRCDACLLALEGKINTLSFPPKKPKKSIEPIFYNDVYQDIIKILGLPDNMAGETLVITLDPENFVHITRSGVPKK